MRSRWYLAVAVWISLCWSLCLAPTAAQAGGAAALTIEAGDANPLMTLEINDGIANLTALQIDLTATGQDVLVDAVTIGFGIPFGEEVTTGREDFLDEIRAQLIVENVEVNGMQDAGETLLGTQSVTDLEDPATVLYTLDPPLTIPAGGTVTLLSIIDVNQPAAQSAGASPSRRLAMALLWAPLIAGMGFIYRRAPGTLHLWVLLVILLGCGLTMTGCTTDDDDNELRFVVNLPSNGITSDGERLGPESAIEGTTILLMR